MPYPKDRPPPPAHTCRVAYEGHVESSPWVNVMNIRNGVLITPNPTALLNLATAMYTFYKDTLLENLSHLTVLDRCVVRYQTPNGDVLGAEFNGTDTGDFADVPYPANVSAAISWTIQQHYRGGHPRNYLAGIPSSQFADNTTLQESWRVAAQSSANQFHRSVNQYVELGQIEDVFLGVVSFVFKKDWRNPPVFRDFTLDQAHVDSRIDSQRRRLGADRA